jgi:ankyrin repeat protein
MEDFTDREYTRRFKLFIDAGVNVNQVDNEGNTPLSYAFDIFAIRALLEAGADPTISNDAGDTVLHGHGDTIPQGLEMVQAILEQPNLDMKRRNDKGYTPLLSTLRHKNSPGNAVDKALMLLKFGTDASAVDNEGNSAFHLAAATKFASTKNENGREVKRELLGEHLIHVLRALGANPNTLNTAGDTPLHTINYRARDFPLDVFCALIEAGLDTESRDKQGRTPLFKAVNHSHNTYRCKNTFDAMVKAGCSFKTLDDRGRNLLFLVTVGDRSDLFPHLLKLGLDPKHVDHDGNTLWHVAVTCGLHTELRTGLIDLGVDPEQPNRRGQTPLHVISGRRTRPFDDANKDLKGPATFDKFLALLRDYDVADENRVTALHIASTFSEYQTKMLLQAGADWTKNRYTREGLTVFHLAARSRQANVVGVLVDFITSKGEKELIPISVNRRDVRGRSAMWYACASGRIETVQMLIDLEAMVEAETYVAHLVVTRLVRSSLLTVLTLSYEGSAWEGCVEFEREQQIWDSSTGSPEIWDHDYSSSHAGATLIGDRTRPTIIQFGKGNAASKHRIDEIVTVLVGYEATARRLLPHAISAAAERGHAYIVDCFIRASELLSARKAANSPEYQLRLQKVLTSPTVVNCIENRRAARDEALRISDDTDHGLARLEKLLSLREYQLAGSILSEAACLTFDGRGESVLHTLVRHGHASILARVCNLDMANKLEDATWCEQQEVAANAPRGSIKPLLFSAILSDVPNMDVIRVLVLNIGVNVNAQTRHMKSTRQVPDVPYAYVKDEGVLHRILRSSTWWQEAQALPFFVSHCANLEMRDRLGRTPLHVALDRAPEVVYDIQTIKQLVSLGADVNALDDSGMSCLGRSLDDMATANFLIQHGARTCIPYKDLLRAIEQSNCAALELLLRQGDDPNCRDFEGEEWITPENPQRKPYLKPGAAYLLEQAACVNENQGYMDIDRLTREKMMSLLVKHGANVNARYSDTTLMHRLIRSSKAVRVLLKYPSLDAHLVDPEGQTILHTACSVERTLKNSLYGEPSYVDMLLQQGADVFARDSKGRNALHFLFTGVERKIAIPDPRAVTAILARAPDLVAQVDDEGNTPLHKASWAAIDHVGELLDAGADPLVVNAKGDTPLHYLVCDTWYAAHGVTLEGARCENFRRILSLGANPNARNLHGETPIFSFLNSNSAVYFTPRWAVPERMSYFSKDWEKALYDVFDDAGVDWHAVNGAGETLMHSAARVGNVELFRFLTGKGVDVGVEDHRQQTALDIAAAVGAGEILGMFERKVDG